MSYKLVLLTFQKTFSAPTQAAYTSDSVTENPNTTDTLAHKISQPSDSTAQSMTPSSGACGGNSSASTNISHPHSQDSEMVTNSSSLDRRSQPNSVTTNTVTNSRTYEQQLDVPRYTQYITHRSRLLSFATCLEVEVDKELLAEAGFFYAGMGDCTRCHWCGLGK